MCNRSSMVTVKIVKGPFQLDSDVLTTGSKKACFAFLMIPLSSLLIYLVSALPVCADILSDKSDFNTQQSIWSVANAVAVFTIAATVFGGFVLYMLALTFTAKRVRRNESQTSLREKKDIAPNSIRSLNTSRVAYRAYLEVLIFAETQSNSWPAIHNLFLRANNKGSTPALKIMVQYAVLENAQSNAVRIFVDRQPLGTGIISGGGPHDHQLITNIILDHNVQNKVLVRISYTDLYGTFVVVDYLAEFSSTGLDATDPNIPNARIYAIITTNPSISYEGITISPRQAMRENSAS